jgi:methionyl-tRNA formyltransferase
VRLALLCATRRGRRVLERVADLVGGRQLVVGSFREEPWEPPFLDEIRRTAAALGADFVPARTLTGAAWASRLDEVDLILAVNWRYLIPAPVWRRPRLGAYAFHDSLLPRYRGFSPTVWAILNGEDHTGATLFALADEVDAGPIVDQERVPIGPDEAIGTVVERVTDAYLAIVARTVPRLLDGTAPRRPQDESLATYACRRLPADNRIDWTASAAAVHNLIRAVSAPYPGAFTSFEGRELRVWSAARVAPERRYVGVVPGRVVEVRPGEGAVVLAGQGQVLLKTVQLEGQPAVCAADLLDRLGHTVGR